MSNYACLEGVVESLHGDFGFINGDDGNTYFFLLSRAHVIGDIARLNKGIRVEFGFDPRRLVPSGKNPFAAIVVILDRELNLEYA